MGPKYCMNYDSGEYEWIDEDGYSWDQGEYVYNWDDSEYCNEDNTLRLFEKLQEYIQDAYGISLNAFNILNK